MEEEKSNIGLMQRTFVKFFFDNEKQFENLNTLDDLKNGKN